MRVETNNGARILHVSGRVCMDQFIVDLKGSAKELGVKEGDTVRLLGQAEVLNMRSRRQTIGRRLQEQ
ncbi:alanine racemase C-terminal domain-containing protein [Gardnerella vaginalis]|uniref:alanine racemase C-terminal domain-containing protein n=1 Tax=Gardnerella vaginalis TaxID=2702 RepID=UPI0038B6E40D